MLHLLASAVVELIGPQGYMTAALCFDTILHKGLGDEARWFTINLTKQHKNCFR